LVVVALARHVVIITPRAPEQSATVAADEMVARSVAIVSASPATHVGTSKFMADAS
jgi:hypothetical protein